MKRSLPPHSLVRFLRLERFAKRARPERRPVTQVLAARSSRLHRKAPQGFEPLAASFTSSTLTSVKEDWATPRAHLQQRTKSV
jgi:hypothetical protein